jgi:phosphatidylglycerophosphate synthase
VATKPWDSRLAGVLVRPLIDTGVHPNHVTTAGLATGLAAAALFAYGTRRAADWGALVFLVAAILDHADGELARMAGKTSAFGHAYDRTSDLVVKLSVFAGMGLGLRHGPLGYWGAFAGLAAGGALVTIFVLRGRMARRHGPAAFRQPSAGGFEIEDVLYGIAPVTWLGGLAPFVVAAGIGAPLFALWVVHQYRSDRVPAA